MKRLFVISLLLVLGISTLAHAQFGATGTTTLSVVVGPEAAISVTSGTTSMSTTGSTFSNPFTGTTNFSYKVRTTTTGGNGAITLKVTTDFGGTGGPSVGSPPTAGDALTYTCSVGGVGTACATAQTALTSASTNVVTFGAATKSSSAGDTGSVVWSLTNDPKYATGTYTATVTFTISAA
jgi:hypothetical protein